MNTPNPAAAETAAQTEAVPTTIASAATPAEISTAPYPDMDDFNIPQLRELIVAGCQARPGLHPESVAELDRRLSYAHERILTLKHDRDEAKPKEAAKLRRLTLAEANHIAHTCAHGPTDPRPLSQPLMEMGLMEFYDDTDAIEQTKLGADCLYGPDRLQYIPAEWMSKEEQKRAGL